MIESGEEGIMKGMMKMAINICLPCLFPAGCAKEPDAVPKPDMVKEPDTAGKSAYIRVMTIIVRERSRREGIREVEKHAVACHIAAIIKYDIDIKDKSFSSIIQYFLLGTRQNSCFLRKNFSRKRRLQVPMCNRDCFRLSERILRRGCSPDRNRCLSIG